MLSGPRWWGMVFFIFMKIYLIRDIGKEQILKNLNQRPLAVSTL
jgi:hypothetical protein